jgi:hypothetical protein
MVSYSTLRGNIPVSAVDGGFHVWMEALAVLACSFHR